MKLSKPPKVYLIGFWLSMPFITLALGYIMYDELFFSHWKYAAVTYPLIYCIGFFSWRLHVEYDALLRRKFPALEQTKKRVLYKLGINLLIMTPSVLLIFFLFHRLHILGYRIQPNDLKYGYLVGLSINVIFETLWEVIYLVDKYKDSAHEKELLERMQLMQEFENLKQKVNPHFLFNCFNTLLALIHEDKKQAEIFLDELSKVYRYLLRTNENGMSSLQQEIGFIRSYASLLKTRHGEGFQLNLEVDAALHCYELPALSLQMLVENAVKHNVISKQKPVVVTIASTPDAMLIIENTLAKRMHKSESTGIGLSNIRDKYKLLHRSDFIVEETNDKFIVRLPLLSTKNEQVKQLAAAD
ncbi:MAG TPA: histidine kinase [Flavisolibacter sp.]|nr:histidine kinase [Flavisolibacter sp.]